MVIPQEDIDAQLKDARFPVYMVNPRLGSNQKTFRFWKHKLSSGADAEWKYPRISGVGAAELPLKQR